MGWTLSAGDGPEGTETPGVRRKQEERGQEVLESCLRREELLQGEGPDPGSPRGEGTLTRVSGDKEGRRGEVRPPSPALTFLASRPQD